MVVGGGGGGGVPSDYFVSTQLQLWLFLGCDNKELTLQLTKPNHDI